VSACSLVAPTSESQETQPAQGVASSGLTSDEAHARFEKDGPNAMPDTSAHLVRNELAKFWAPPPCLHEASVVLEIVLQKYYEAAVIAALVVSKATLPYFQESRAQATLAALRSRLALSASVERDGAWKTLPKLQVRGNLRNLLSCVLNGNPSDRKIPNVPRH
jgi:H+-transporting ATPase